MNPRLLPPARLARSVLRTQSDERLTELAQRGSDAAFETLVTRYRRSMVRHCGRVVGHSDAEEAVQNALVNAHHALTRGDSVRNVGPWLHTIAHNAALNILRARASRPEAAQFDTAPVEHHDFTAERRQQLREVVDVLQSLPLRQRDAIVMRELEGLSYEEIAARLGSSSGAVRQLLNRARNAIRERLGALTGVEPLIRWFAGGSGGAPTAARLGALAGGCAVTAKLCTAALIPAAAVVLAPPHPAPPHVATPHVDTAAHQAATLSRTPRTASKPAAPTTRYVTNATTPRAQAAVVRTLTTTGAARPAIRLGPATTRSPAGHTPSHHPQPPATTTSTVTTSTTTPAPQQTAKQTAANCPPRPTATTATTATTQRTFDRTMQPSFAPTATPSGPAQPPPPAHQ